MKRLAWFFMLVLVSSGANAADVQPVMSVEDEARALIGVEYTPRLPGDHIADHLSCTDEEGGLLDDDGIRSYGIASCQGRRVVILSRNIGKVDAYTTWRIVDCL